MLKRYFPILTWAPNYHRATFEADLVAAVIVTIMLIPQSLAYALLAGLPAHVGLYASIAPLLLYTLLGTSRALAVGPVAVASLMTAAAVGEIAAKGTPEYLGAAIALAFLSGAMLLAMGFLRLGFIASFLSHPVISGFISASGILIAASQIKHLLGISANGKTLPEIVGSLTEQLGATNTPTLIIGIGAVAFLFWARNGLRGALMALGLRARLAGLMVRAAPVFAVFVTILATWGLNLEAEGVRVVGRVPQGLPTPAMPPLDLALWAQLAVPALLISIVGYVETISVAQTLAAKRRQRIDPDQELVALGGANLASAFSGGFPVTGGFARSVVNFDAGAETPAAGAFTAIGMGLATLLLTPALYYLPQATLAATIVVAVLSLVDLGAIRRTYNYSRGDALAMVATIIVTLGIGVEAGISAGVGLSVLMQLWRSSRPHYAVLGQVPGTEHFRNINRHRVITAPDVLSLRVDASLWFPNARFLEDTIYGAVAGDPAIRHVVLNCPAVNFVDSSALEALEAVNQQLKDAGVLLHLSEVKGPVMDRLKRSDLITHLGGQVFLTHHDALCALSPDLTMGIQSAPRCETAR
ncbi:SulP family inorganic anion transporter [Sedimentimonas flavescens]|uniref:SulP family inorganic anion transporter n=1 Tax=Sedimentimonas flavescens TaxID=2851012 RepID=UPI0021A38C51|nr:sulfate permease [Sedimentimonas flavescens]MCT2538386.1 sulfate permease [Sedimentimonas flavescens]